MISRTEILPAIVGFSIAAFLTYGVFLWRVPAPIEYFQRSASQVVVRAGDRVTVTWSEVRRDRCESTVHRRLIAADKSITEFETVVIPAQPEKIEIRNKFSFIIPTGLAEGPLIYRVHAQFHCNAVQHLLGGPDFVLPDIVFSYTR